MDRRNLVLALDSCYRKGERWGKTAFCFQRFRKRHLSVTETCWVHAPLTLFISSCSFSMSLSCCKSFSVRLSSHDVSYTRVSMVTKLSPSCCNPGIFRSFARRTRERAQSTWRPHTNDSTKQQMLAGFEHNCAVSDRNRWKCTSLSDVMELLLTWASFCLCGWSFVKSSPNWTLTSWTVA